MGADSSVPETQTEFLCDEWIPVLKGQMRWVSSKVSYEEKSIDDGPKVSDVYAIKSTNAIPERLRRKLNEELEKYGDNIDDFRTNAQHGTVHDIIDPSLDCDSNGWISSDFELQESSVLIRSDINTLPRLQTSELYECIANVFHKIRPMLLPLGIKSKRLHVIVKAMNYVLNKGESWESLLHREGQTQFHIKAVVIYYYSIDANIKGGKLELVRVMKEFRPNYSQQLVKVKEGMCVAFLNDEVYHRMKTVQYRSTMSFQKRKEPAKRKILAFFIVDPDEYDRFCSDKYHVNVRAYFGHFFCESIRHGMEYPLVIKDIIKSYVGVLSQEESFLNRIEFKKSLQYFVDPLDLLHDFDFDLSCCEDTSYGSCYDSSTHQSVDLEANLELPASVRDNP